MKVQELGVVTDCRPGVVQVTILKNSAEECGGDGDCGGCASRQERAVVWDVESTDPALAVGRKVLIEVEPPSAYYGIFFLLALPMLVFFVTLLVAYSYAGSVPSLASWQAGFGVLSAGGATVLSYVLAALVDRKLRGSEKHKPRILKVVDPCSETGSQDKAFLLLVELSRWHDPLQVNPVLDDLKQVSGVLRAEAAESGRLVEVLFDKDSIGPQAITGYLKNRGLDLVAI